MFNQLAKAIALNKASEVLRRDRRISIPAQKSINTWALAELGKPAYSDDGILQDGFAIGGWDLFSRYFWVNHSTGKKAKFSNATGNRKK